MPLSHRALQVVSFLGVFVLACYSTSQEIENKRAVTEHQFLHDKGRTIQGLKRLMWLHNAMGGVHTASGRDLPRAIVWDVQKAKDAPLSPDTYTGPVAEEPQDLLKQLLVKQAQEEPAFKRLKKNDLPQCGKYREYRRSLQ
ncbi:parathyroid hormone 4-like [Ambystoma mexicanum]|uniref:parathyroid hormone 4-like n=1 Tax=Ambystoma mexicanum TaxID=8296 RepID=UPI0037E757D6